MNVESFYLNNKIVSEGYKSNKLIKGQEYYHTLETFREGPWPNTRYFAEINKLRFVGTFIENKSFGYCGDGSREISYFKNNDKIIQISSDYEGKNLFIPLQK